MTRIIDLGGGMVGPDPNERESIFVPPIVSLIYSEELAGLANPVVSGDKTAVSGKGVKPNSTVVVYKNGTQVGTATANGSGAWSYTFGSALSAGDIVTYDAVLTSPTYRVLGTSSVGTTPAITKLPANSRIAYTGDSITNYGASGDGLLTSGYAGWAQMLSGGRCLLPSGGVLGYPGQTSTYVLNQFASVLALNPAVVVIECGTNNLAVPQTIISDITNMVGQVRAAGAKSIVLCIPPRNGIDAPTESNRQAANTGIKALAASDVQVVDLDSAYVPATMAYDGLHPNAIGGRVIGQAVATAIGNFVSPYSSLLFTANNDPANGVGNGLFKGTGGNAQNGTLGTVPDGWAVTCQYAGGAVATCSKDTDDSLILTLSGTYTGSGNAISLIDYNAAPVPAFASGSKVESYLQFEASGLQNVAAIEVIQPNVGLHPGASAGPLPSDAFSGVIRTIPEALTSGTTFSSPGIRIYLADVSSGSATIAGTIKFKNFGIRQSA